mgnify:CR=1 FL=1
MTRTTYRWIINPLFLLFTATCGENNISGSSCLSGVDSDSDGLTDDVECSAGTDPNNADSDGDGVTDNVEWLAPGGDGNEDGRFDALQNDVVSLSYPESNLRGSSRQQTLSNIELRVGEQASGFSQVQVLPKLTATEIDPNGAIAPLQFVRSGRSALVQIKYAGEYFSDDARFYWLGRPGATGAWPWCIPTLATPNSIGCMRPACAACASTSSRPLRLQAIRRVSWSGLHHACVNGVGMCSGTCRPRSCRPSWPGRPPPACPSAPSSTRAAPWPTPALPRARAST